MKENKLLIVKKSRWLAKRTPIKPKPIASKPMAVNARFPYGILDSTDTPPLNTDNGCQPTS